jgi:hypothetical protein
VHALAVGLVLLHGVVMRGPTTPTCDLATPCSEPAAFTSLVFVRAGATPVRTRTDAHGRYAVRLRPGRYVVRVARIRPTAVVVRRSMVADFAIDTGIR